MTGNVTCLLIIPNQPILRLLVRKKIFFNTRQLDKGQLRPYSPRL